MAELTAKRQASFASTALAVVAFGVAMGYLEATVVVYLRAAIGIVPSAASGNDPRMFGAYGSFEAIETVRELATLVMIAAVGWLAGRTRLERLAWAAVVFGAWDIIYYLGLRQLIGWPPDLATWDVLFLVPVPWVGPVWAPIAVSAALIGFGLAGARRMRAGLPVVVGRARAIAALAGGGLVIASFVVDTDPCSRRRNLPVERLAALLGRHGAGGLGNGVGIGRPPDHAYVAQRAPSRWLRTPAPGRLTGLTKPHSMRRSPLWPTR